MTAGEGAAGPLVCLIDRGDVPLPELEAEIVKRHVRVMRAQGDAHRAVRALSPDVVLLREEDASALLGSLEREASAVGATVVVIGRADWVEPRSSPFRAGGVVTLPASAGPEALALRIANEATEARERRATRPWAPKDDPGIDEFAAMATTRDLRAADRARADVLAAATARDARAHKRPPAGLFSGGGHDGPTTQLPMPEAPGDAHDPPAAPRPAVPRPPAPRMPPPSRPAREEPTREIQLRSAEVRAAFDATADEVSLPAAAPIDAPLPPPLADDEPSLTSRDVGGIAEARTHEEPPTAPLLAAPPSAEPATIPKTTAPVLPRQDATVGLAPKAPPVPSAAPSRGLGLLAAAALLVLLAIGGGGAWLAMQGALTPAPVLLAPPSPASTAAAPSAAPIPSVEASDVAPGAPDEAPGEVAPVASAAPIAEAAAPAPAEAPAAGSGSESSSELLARAAAAPDAEAEPLYRQILAADPREFHAALALADILMRRGEPAEAIPFIEIAVHARRRRGAYHLLLGDAYQQAGDAEHAQAAWREALEIDPNDHAAQQRLGQ